jgi:hypothetical protein
LSGWITDLSGTLASVLRPGGRRFADVFDPEFPRDQAYCQDCERHRFAFDLERSYGRHAGEMVLAILLLKLEKIHYPKRSNAKLTAWQPTRRCTDTTPPQRAREPVPLARLLGLPYRPVAQKSKGSRRWRICNVQRRSG